MADAVELISTFPGAHLLRTWGEIVDTTLDASPSISPSSRRTSCLSWTKGKVLFDERSRLFESELVLDEAENIVEGAIVAGVDECIVASRA